MMALKGEGSSALEQVCTRLCALSEHLGESTSPFFGLLGLEVIHFVRGETNTACALSQQLLSIATATGNNTSLLWAHHALGLVLSWKGEVPAARQYLEKGLVYYQPWPRIPYVLDPKVVSLVYMALGSYLRGQLERAPLEIATARAWAQELAHPYSLAFVFIGEVMLGLFLRGSSSIQPRADTIVALCREHNFSQYEALGRIIQGWELIETGQHEIGVVQIQEGLSACRATGLECGLTPWLIQLAIGYRRLGQVATGLSILNETIASTNCRGEGLFTAELYRVKGELLLAREAEEERQRARRKGGNRAIAKTVASHQFSVVSSERPTSKICEKRKHYC